MEVKDQGQNQGQWPNFGTQHIALQLCIYIPGIIILGAIYYKRVKSQSQGHSDLDLVHDTLPSHDVSTNQVW